MKRRFKIFIITLMFLLIFPVFRNIAFGNNIKVNNQNVTDSDIISCIRLFIELDDNFFGIGKENIIVSGKRRLILTLIIYNRLLRGTLQQ